MNLKAIVLLGAAICLSSCATVVRGTHEKLRVVSTPSGADVKLSSGETGVTPATFVKNRRDNFQVIVSKPGYDIVTVNVESRASGGGVAATAANAVTGGVIGAAVDAGTGAWNSLYPNPVSVQLTPLPVDPRVVTRLRKRFPLG